MRRKFGAAARRRIAQAEFISAEHFKNRGPAEAELLWERPHRGFRSRHRDRRVILPAFRRFPPSGGDLLFMQRVLVLHASGGVSRKPLRRFRLRVSFFLRAQKETKDALKDPWSLRIPFASKPAPCLPLDSAFRAPTRISPACCRPWALEGPSVPDEEAPCGGSRRSVGRHPPTPSIPALRRRRGSTDGASSAKSGRNGRRKRDAAARVRAPDASANVHVFAPVKWGGLGGGGAYGSPPQRSVGERPIGPAPL